MYIINVHFTNINTFILYVKYILYLLLYKFYINIEFIFVI